VRYSVKRRGFFAFFSRDVAKASTLPKVDTVDVAHVAALYKERSPEGYIEFVLKFNGLFCLSAVGTKTAVTCVLFSPSELKAYLSMVCDSDQWYRAIAGQAGSPCPRP
jgi:hypothetical protein